MKRMTNEQKIAKVRSIHSVVVEAAKLHEVHDVVNRHVNQWGENGGRVVVIPLASRIRVDMYTPHFMVDPYWR